MNEKVIEIKLNWIFTKTCGATIIWDAKMSGVRLFSSTAYMNLIFLFCLNAFVFYSLLGVIITPFPFGHAWIAHVHCHSLERDIYHFHKSIVDIHLCPLRISVRWNQLCSDKWSYLSGPHMFLKGDILYIMVIVILTIIVVPQHFSISSAFFSKCCSIL